jgi:hypothetical protein
MREKIIKELGIPCFDPPNATRVRIRAVHPLGALVADELLAPKRPPPSEGAAPVGKRILRPQLTADAEGVVFFKPEEVC